MGANLAMPIYEYRCQSCGRLSSVFTRSVNQILDPACSHCNSKEVRRAISSFAYHRSTRASHGGAGNPSGPGYSSLDYYRDPQNVGRHLEESFEKHGMEMPESVRETIDAARGGDLPEGLDL